MIAEPVESNPHALEPELDPRRWITLAIILTAVLIAALDSTVLNVAIPTILEEFDTTLPALQWVVTGYSLTFAALLIIGGRLGDIFGARRMFIVGAALFGVGSFLASISNGVVALVIGEAVIEGMGASLMLPATMGILSSTFTGRERATAFATWGAAMGAAVAFGPLIGGFLTTNYSWRWAFRINVMVVPFAIGGALLFMPKSVLSGRRERIDVPGALLIASGMFLLVFGISEGATYGWLVPEKAFEIAGVELWPVSMPVSIVPVAFVASVVLLVSFYRVQRAKERTGS
ncbi:MAG TPA: MFS transporter, partial [Acidimicrobiales bacterium]|nr:MFS transporter [Acidimicrobiales bacterium]